MPVSITPVSVVEAVCEALTAEIMQGLVRPGAALPEAGIASRYGVSRLTARDAIARLVSTGLLQRERNRSAWLPVLDRRALQELVAVRVALEESSVYSRRHDPQMLATMDMATQGLRQSADRLDPQQVWDAELAFHRELARLGGNARLAKVHAGTQAEACIAFVQAPGAPSALQIAVQHARILRALREGDLERAAGELRHHARELVDRVTRGDRHSTHAAGAPEAERAADAGTDSHPVDAEYGEAREGGEAGSRAASAPSVGQHPALRAL